MPELAVLSARAHGNGPDGLAVLAAAIGCLERLDPEAAGVYFHIIYKALRDPVRRALEAMVMSRASLAEIPLAPFIQKLVDEGRQEGKVEGLREALIGMARRAGVPLPDAALERIATCKDITTLKHWVENAWTARTADELLA